MAKYRILSFDGGGVRGLLTAVLLEQLLERVPGWLDKADLLAGTSTGGIIALGLAKGLTPSDLRRLYFERSRHIFADSPWDDIRDLFGVVGAQYGTKNLKRELEAVFGKTRLMDLRKRVLIPTLDLEDPGKKQWKPKFFHNFPGNDSDGSSRAVDVALHTSAAPTYFPSVDGYIDGGVCANNPSMSAVAQTQDERIGANRPKIDDIVLLSVGTGQMLSRIRRKTVDWGFGQWAKPLVKLMLDGVVGVPHYQCSQILRDRYHRLNYTFPPGKEMEMDDYTKVDDLVRIGEEKMRTELSEAAEWLKSTWM